MSARIVDGSGRSPIYWAAAGLVFLVALYGWEAGAFVPYAIVALICVVQFFWPTVVVWGLVFALYAVASCLYMFMLLRDVWSLMTNGDVSVLLDIDDSIIFIIFVVAVILISLGLFRARPKSIRFWRKGSNIVQPNNALEQTRER